MQKMLESRTDTGRYKPTSFAEHLKDGRVEVAIVTEDVTKQTSEKTSR